MRSMPAAPFLLAALLSGIAAAAGAQGDRPTGDELGWLESFLMTEEERAAAVQATTRGDRETFRRLFWMRRDPDRSTPANETLDHFLGRVRLADRNFSADGGYGGGDRSRVFVLLGMPLTAIPRPATEKAPEGLTWVYRADPEAGLAADLEARFERDPEGGLWLLNRMEVDAALEEMRARLISRPDLGYERGGNGRLEVPDFPAGGSERARSLLASFPISTDADGNARVGDIRFEVTPAFFRMSDEATYVALQIEAPAGVLAAGPDGQSAATAFARESRVPHTDAPGSTRFRFQSAYTEIQPADQDARFETALVLSPGRHRLVVGVVDEQSEAFGAGEIELLVPEFADTEPRFSSVVLYGDARETEAMDGAPGHAFQFGGMHFEPRGARAFRRNESLGVFYFFYPGEVPDGIELPRIVAEYEVLRDGRETGYVRPEAMPTSTLQAAANAEIPLNGLPPGEYELRIRVRYLDSVYEETADFRVTN